jgi:hypothetical protein
MMYASALQVAEFDQLTAPLMMSGSDLPHSIQRLEATARLAVPSMLGWSLTVKVSGADVTLTSIDPSATAADVRASLMVPLSAFLTVGLDGGMVFYAAEPHAFYRYAGDFIPILGPAICLLRTDQNLNPNMAAGLRGVREMTVINEAIAVMITGGDTADTARDWLQATARSAHLTLRQSAQNLLAKFAAKVAPAHRG